LHTKISRFIGASGTHTGTMSFDKMGGDASDLNALRLPVFFVYQSLLDD